MSKMRELDIEIKEHDKQNSHRNNNSGIDGAIFKNSLLGKYIETNKGNKGIVIEEWLCYPEPSEWKLEDGTVITEDSSELFTLIKEVAK